MIKQSSIKYSEIERDFVGCVYCGKEQSEYGCCSEMHFAHYWETADEIYAAEDVIVIDDRMLRTKLSDYVYGLHTRLSMLMRTSPLNPTRAEVFVYRAKRIIPTIRRQRWGIQ